MQKKLKPLPVKYFFNLIQAKIVFSRTAELKISILRKGKSCETKPVKFSPDNSDTEIKQILEFMTTVEQQQLTSSYVPKTATMKITLWEPNSKPLTNEAQIQLTEFLNQEPKRKKIKLEGQLQQIFVEFCTTSKIDMHNQNAFAFKSVRTIRHKNQHLNDLPLDSKINNINEFKSQIGINVIDPTEKAEIFKSSKLILKGKEPSTMKSICLPQEISAEQTQPNYVRKQMRRALTTIKKSPDKYHDHVRLDCINEKVGSNCSIQNGVKEHPKASSLSKKKSVKIIEDNNEKNSYQIQDNLKQIPNMFLSAGNQVQDCKLKIQSLQIELKEYAEKNMVLKKQNKQLHQKIIMVQRDQQSASQVKDQMIKKLNVELDSKKKQIKQLQAQIENQCRKRQKCEENYEELKNNYNKIRLEKDKLILESKFHNSKGLDNHSKQNSLKQELEKIIQEYKQQNEQLKLQLQRKTKLLNHMGSNSTNQKSSDVCYGKKCESERKQANNKLKQAKKTIEELEAKIETKQKLIKTYQNLREDQKKENSSENINRQREKSRAQKMIYEQRIRELEQKLFSLSEKPSADMKRIQSEVNSLKTQKDGLSRQLQKHRLNLNRIVKDKQNIQTQIISSKQRVMDILNAVQQYGGMKLFDKISNLIL